MGLPGLKPDMATDEFLLDRMRNILRQKNVEWMEKRMFGGDCFMVDNKMLIGTFQGGLMARVAPEETEELITRNATSQMMMKDRVMKGYLRIEPEGYDTDDDLEFWVDKCLEFNPKAKASKKK